MKRNLAAAFLAAFFVTGCDLLVAFEDGYQPGDVLETIIRTKAEYDRAVSTYCALTSEEAQSRLIERIRAYDPTYAGRCEKG